ncbi:hypothetical protein [Tateyamaria omphalii]|uniref:Two component regulator propeller n=1 Tax=Tateyamaria omphalii TaxID=299262 RepID=A0A1P8MUH9_9RHOB|nr:hypothetical protein [Tateyamaria omphalii]APX11589.1 hypothetical protein BWR18_07755 [Tateyamaria omphalii]
MQDDIQALIDEGMIDPSNTEFTIITGAAIEADYMLFLETADAYAEVADEIELTFVTTWNGQNEAVPWRQNPHEWQGASCCVWRSFPQTRLYVALSLDGHVHMFGPGGRPTMNETIQGAGRMMPWSNDEYVTTQQIREIGSSLYVVGSNRKVFRRAPTPDATWEMISAEIQNEAFNRETGLRDMTLMSHFFGVHGRVETSIFTCGVSGEVFHFDGSNWSEVPTGTHKHLLDVHVASDGTVYVIGADGTFLRGDASGLRPATETPLPDRPYLTGIAERDGAIWIAGNRGLYRYDPNTETAERIRPEGSTEINDFHHLSVADGVLWSIGFKDLAYFDGSFWTRLAHPENGPRT